MADEDLRPEPEALLAEAAREGRGRLKIFLGAAPGVGKTFAMLEAARQRLREGTDVVAGVIETHGRAETEALVHSLPVVPRRPGYYRGRILSEMDLDALLARRPRLALIDELAHTNLEGSRHEKRWQDVEEVLAAGIDVWTTLNVQHVETLNDAVARITGIRVRETVPDRILDTADEIELIDLSPEDLIARLRAGKVYVPEQAARAVQNFFAKGNLTALRELAMRAAADRVDAQLREHMAANAIPGPWPAQERLLVCVSDSPAARNAIRAAKRSADRARVEWIALSVTSPRIETLPEGARDDLALALRLAERLGATVASLQAGGDVAREILDFARRNNVRRIIVGRPRPRSTLHALAHPFRERVAERLLRLGTEFEVTLVSAEPGRARPQARRLPALSFPVTGWALLATALASGAAWVVDRMLPVASLALLFMTAVIVVATRFGRWASALTAVSGFFAYNFFFTEPRLTFTVHYRDQILTLGLFLAASLLTGGLAAELRARVDAQRAAADRMGKLYDFSRRVAAAAAFDDVVWAAVSHVSMTLACRTVLLVPEGERLAVAGGFPPEDRLELRDMSAARYAWQRGEEAGRGSATLPAADWLFLPIRAGERRLGVVGVAYEGGRSFSPVDRRLLDALIDQVALAMERVRLAEDLEGARLAAETDRLRTALLSSVSHDLRTPLVTIIGAAGSLAEPGALPPEAQQALAETIREEGERLDRYVQNLLDMTRLGHGALKPAVQPSDLAELVGAARTRLAAVLRGHRLGTDLPPDLPAVLVDPVLTEQVLVNILDNAAKYAPPGSPITLAARLDAGRVVLSVADEGPGIPPADREKVFDMFYRVAGTDRRRAGTGLGLAICRGLLEAQGGTIRAEAARPDGQGTRILLTLPVAP
ncbi:sensor histidine kinase KdpD [Cereibacter sphaeroides]|uniref:sensor histidine kinase n=1 Tax=Cereibacter sphaeroides TaxID=1063 RepID=UPI000F548BCF|nr:sensor histidine kinase KdpD [Cereibacter sphaeroides]AZB62321.1 sensor histidine kinase KdpD [Cereibacter sphaeroides]AZB69732.1 sensor histidine kinase KdpD [Cereibacter sphaeroides]